MMGRDLNDMSQVMAVMVLIMLLGYTVDRALFHTMEKRIQRKWGLVPPA
jgi:NitT/TauT family transport system permease protein